METQYSKEYLMEQALRTIANPIQHLQEEAKKVGGELNGGYAISLANNANWLQGIAQDVLKKVDSMTATEKEKEDKAAKGWEDQRETMYNAWKEQNPDK